MRNIVRVLALCFALGQVSAQENIGYLLVSGIEDTRKFTENYVSPTTEGVIQNLSNGWYQTAEVKSPLGFELSIIGNASLNLEEHQTFSLDTEEYNNLHFADGSTQKEVATILGAEMANEVYIEHEGRQIHFFLPQGIGSGVDMLPTAFLQARLGIFKGTEIKARFLPKLNTNDVEAQLFGGAIQHEFTSWLPADNVLPVAVSGIVGYTQLRGAYDFSNRGFLEGENQQLKAQMDSWLFSAIVSTNLPVINFYGGLGYVSGSSETEMLGSYNVVDENTGITLVSMVDPFVISSSTSGMRANLGFSLKLGFLKFNADYNFQEYETVSVGLHVGI